MIRQTEERDIADVLRIYEAARAFMRASGNPSQWADGYPSEGTVRADIARAVSYVLEGAAGQIYATFALIPGDDPTYGYIEDGAWRDLSPYATIHRAASDGARHGVFRAMLAFARKRWNHLRADTHADNAPMRRCLEGNGFVRRGTIYVRGRSPRLAYEWSK